MANLCRFRRGWGRSWAKLGRSLPISAIVAKDSFILCRWLRVGPQTTTEVNTFASPRPGSDFDRPTIESARPRGANMKIRSCERSPAGVRHGSRAMCRAALPDGRKSWRRQSVLAPASPARAAPCASVVRASPGRQAQRPGARRCKAVQGRRDFVGSESASLGRIRPCSGQNWHDLGQS